MRSPSVLILALAASLVAAHAASITVTPVNESVAINKTRQMTAAVAGLSSSAVTWLVNGMPGGTAALGTINANGLYSAPASLPTPNPVTITALSATDPTVSGSVPLAVRLPGPTVSSMSPTSAAAGTVTLTLTGSGFQPGAIVYLLTTPLTTTYISSTQLKATGYFTTLGNNFIRVANPGTMYSSILTLSIYYGGSSATLSISPTTTLAPISTTQQFTATSNGSAVAVTWSATAGAISSTGLYTAPAAIPNPSTVTITAAGNGMTATAAVTVISNVPPVITQVNPAPVPTGVYALTINGTGFIQGSQAALNGSPLSTQYVSPTQLIASGFAAGSSTANLVVSNASIASQPYPVQIGVSNPQVSVATATRFLQQAGFGPGAADIMRVQQLGLTGWLNEQFAMTPVSTYSGITANQGGMPQRFLTNAVMNKDQLRQKVGWALSQIWVTSLTKLIWNGDMVPYQNLLLAGAFSNYRQIMKDVTLSPAMGYYLDMANNGKANAAGTVLPNENYAREVLQLFTIGTAQLNPDGTPIKDASNIPVPSYTQSTITELARVFTGWTYAPAPGGAVVWNAYRTTYGPLQPYTGMHDYGSKQLWPNQSSAFIPGGLAPMQDLEAALDIIYQHPNLPPFISKQLIQHLVMSNPSPAYVKDIADVFIASNGDMKAVVTAILTHAEARRNDTPGLEQPTDGHLQEPALFLAGLFRALGSQVNDQNYFSSDLAVMGQDIFNPASVFNYYRPGAEFQIYTPYTSVYRANLVGSLFNAYNNPIQSYGPGWTADISAYVTLASTPQTLVDALDVSLMGGLMPSSMKSTIVTAVQNDGGGNLHRVQTAIYLIASSGYYNVWR